MFVHIFNPMMSDRTDAVRLTRQCFWPLRSCSRCFCGAACWRTQPRLHLSGVFLL